jgi:hypothetical protein
MLGGLIMKSEIFSILSTALERADQQDKKSRKPRFSSVFEQKVLENLRRSSEYQNYVRDNSINGVAILMNNDKDLVYAEIAKLSTLCVKDLKQLYKDKIGAEPPSYMQKRALADRLAYFLQEQAYGALPEDDRQQLEAYKLRIEKGEPLIAQTCELNAGMILTREYNGRKYSVKLLDDEKVEYDGKVYNSLSAVAREITGVRWNGPKFFRVTRR